MVPAAASGALLPAQALSERLATAASATPAIRLFLTMVLSSKRVMVLRVQRLRWDAAARRHIAGRSNLDPM
ncbi:hypothetical protein GCM10027029_06240 [Conyzicola lurida]